MPNNKTRSPGIKSCYEVRDILMRGVFELCAVPDKHRVLTLRMSGTGLPCCALANPVGIRCDLGSSLWFGIAT